MARLDEVNFDEFDFDSPDEPVGTGRRTNMSKKLVIAFAKLSLDGFEGRLGQIVTGMTGNTFLPEPWWANPAEKPTVASLTADKAAFTSLKGQAADGDKGKIAARDAMRESITADLKKLAKYIELKADGDVEILESTGYELTKERTPAGSEPLPAPANLRLRRSGLSGVLIATCAAVKGAASYETHICPGESIAPANWSQACITKGCRRIELSGLTRGVVYNVRVRAINQNGPGVWSDVASLMAD